MPPSLLWTAIGHAILTVACALALGRVAKPILGLHPAIKPLKFAVSIALFLATMGLVLPSLSIPASQRTVLSWLFAVTMTVESGAIVTQALRGTTSHFNRGHWFDAILWKLMMAAIVVTSLGMAWVAVVATFWPMAAGNGSAMAPLLAAAWRVGLWLFMLVPVSGFAMGGRQRHSIGGEDGGPGLPFVNFSVEHGDLRVAHFIALHALQALPLVAWALLGLEIPPAMRTVLFVAVVSLTGGLCVGTLAQAFRGRPFLRTAQ